jgi:hypothetical protein
MSNPKRYDVGMTTEFNPHGFNHSFPRVYEAEQGKYVEYADYARLLAAVDELKSQPDPLTAYLYAAELAKDDIKRLKAKVERLTKMKQDLFDSNDQQVEHIERLTRAGDAMAFHYHQLELRVGNYSFSVKAPSIQAWEKAKGVQS